MLKLTTDKHEASCGLSATAELLVGYAWSQLNSVCNSERIIKIGQYLRKLRSNKKKMVQFF